MLRSSGVLKPFANCDIKTNKTLENSFGLLEHPPVYEETPFVIAPNQDGRLVFGESPSTLLQAKIEVIGRTLAGNIDPGAAGDIHCPAVGIVLNSMWAKAVESCVENPELYPADLARIHPGAVLLG
jgi:hypothetical protein